MIDQIDVPFEWTAIALDMQSFLTWVISCFFHCPAFFLQATLQSSTWPPQK